MKLTRILLDHGARPSRNARRATDGPAHERFATRRCPRASSPPTAAR
ncbi:hypothetical protein [Streptomyces sp. NPDC057682]